MGQEKVYTLGDVYAALKDGALREIMLERQRRIDSGELVPGQGLVEALIKSGKRALQEMAT